MFTNRSTIPIKLGILLVGFGLLVVGCDSTGTNAGDEEQNEVEEQVAFEAVDANLGDRITNFDGSSSNSVTTTAQKSAPGFTITDQLSPPTAGFSDDGDEAASHLALSKSPGSGSADRNLYIGYKLEGSDFGGGIDIVTANGSFSFPTEVGGDATTLRSSAVDVQELAVRSTSGGNDPNALYAATAVDPDVGVRRAPQFHSIGLNTNDGLPNSTVDFDAVELLNSEGDGSPSSDPTQAAKSLVVDAGNSNGDVFAVSDENTAHGIPVDVGGDGYTIDENNIATIEVPTSRNYRSVTQTSSGFYALDFSGRIYSLDFGSGSDTEETSSSLGTISNPSNDLFSIARLSSYDFSGTKVLFAALNEGGFSVYNPNVGGEVYSDPDTYATSAAATEDYVYVASGNGIAVYEVEGSGLSNTDAGGDNTGLEYIGTQTLDSLPNASGASSDVQINDILIDENGSSADPTDDVLFVAKSTDGVFRLTVDVNSAWNP